MILWGQTAILYAQILQKTANSSAEYKSNGLKIGWFIQLQGDNNPQMWKPNVILECSSGGASKRDEDF